MYDLVSSATYDILVDLIKQWAKLRATKREEELQTPEWKRLEQAYMKHLEWRFQYPSKVFGQQLLASWLLTLLVIGLVVTGLAYSFIQLNYAMKVGDISSLNTEIEIQTAGKLSLSSSVLGAAVLGISLLFFNLYLKHVFQIRHPIPPHVSLSETDAATIWQKFKEKASGSSTVKSAGNRDSSQNDSSQVTT